MEVARFARDVVQIDPSAAVIWAEQIQDEKRRDQTVRSIAETWTRIDTQKAESWLRQNSYSEEWIEKVMERVL
jgi:hypothetical protein